MKSALEEFGWKVSKMVRRREYSTFDLSTMKDDPKFLDNLCRMMEEDGSLASYLRTSGTRPDRLDKWIEANPERARRLSAAYEKFDRRYPRCYNSRAAEKGGGIAVLVALALGVLSMFVSSDDTIYRPIWLGMLAGFFSAQLGAQLTRRARDRPIAEIEEDSSR